MTGKLYIDSNDAYSVYGVFVTEGGYNSLIAYPSLKPVEVNDWPEENGIELDLSAPKLSSREISLPIAQRGGNIDNLIQDLSQGAFHEFTFTSLSRSYDLRYKGISNYNYFDDLQLMTLILIDDFPLSGYSYVNPSGGIASSRGFTLDSKDFADYGIVPLEGSIGSLLKPREVKPNLTIDTRYINGSIYDGEGVYFKSKEATLYLLLRANTIANMWRNYDAFLYDLIRPNARTISAVGKSFVCYYKSAVVEAFLPQEKLIKFSITVEII